MQQDQSGWLKQLLGIFTQLYIYIIILLEQRANVQLLITFKHLHLNLDTKKATKCHFIDIINT